jgi:PadR family transcriptional regulator PadR
MGDRMMRDLLKKDLHTLILSVVLDGPVHGYGISRKIETRSNNMLKMREGSLYPALRTLEQEGLISGTWEVQESGPARRVYQITAEGRAEYSRRTEEWKEYVTMVDSLIGGKTNAQPA